MGVDEKPELTPYDEYPVHQYSRPFSEVPSTDRAWDDGYFKSVFSTDRGLYLICALRINPNLNIIGGSVSMAYRGKQYVIRLSRLWRTEYDTHIGPFRYRIIEPFKDVQLVLEANASPVTFDLHWHGVAPAYLESQHFARIDGRIVNDQSRYVQVGEPTGWIEIAGERIPVDRNTWCGASDHSWGLYQTRAPLAPPKQFLAPPPPPNERALRFWTMFKLPNYAGFFGLIEDKDGVCRPFNDWLGSTPFQGAIDWGWSRRLELVSGRHALRFQAGTQILTGGRVEVVDAEGGTWIQEFECATPSFLTLAGGYWVGSWSDGGTVQTYHGEGTTVEWEEIDVAKMPMDFHSSAGPVFKNTHGIMYGTRLRMTDPNGKSSEGLQHITFWVEGDYKRYGFTGGRFF